MPASAPDVRRLLIAHRDPAWAIALSKRFDDPGIAVEIAVTGAEALARAREFRPHAVILDAHLPGVDGYRVFRDIRVDPVLRYARAILVGRHEDSGALLLAKDLGAYACFEDSASVSALHDKTLSALGWREAVSEAQRAIVVVIASKSEGAAAAVQVEEAGFKAAVAEDLDTALGLCRSPRVRAVVLIEPPEGLSVEAFVESLRTAAIRAPVLQMTTGAPGCHGIATLAPPLTARRLAYALDDLGRRPGKRRQGAGPAGAA